MKYRDLSAQSRGKARELKQQCLIWSENHEHAVASIDDDIHPQAKRVWLEFEGLNVIYVYEKHWKTGDWELVEDKKGNIPLVNNNPFKPDSESVFPVNKDVLPTKNKEKRFHPVEITDPRFEETYTAYLTKTFTGWSGRIPDVPEVNKCEETTKQALLTTLKDNLYEALKARSDAWDKQIEEDILDGKLDDLREAALEEIKTGKAIDL